MKKILLWAFIVLPLSVSCSKSPDEKAKSAIEDYFERMWYPCEVVSVEWGGDVNCSYFDPQYQRLVKKSDKYFKAYLLADWASEKEESKKLHDEISKEMAKLRDEWGDEQYNYFSCIVKCSDYKMKKDLESLYYYIDPSYKKVAQTASQLNW